MFAKLRAALAVFAVLAAGCGNPETKAPEKKAVEEVKPASFFRVDPATAGTIHGRIVYKGAKPARQVIVMDSDAGCQVAHKGRPAYDEAIMTGKEAGLANVFVYIKTGLEGKTFEPNKEAVTLDQNGCLFVPRVVGLRAGQTLNVKNSDSVSHNIHPMPQNNREWNQQQSPQTPDLQHRFPRPEIMIPVKCNVHSWMHAYIGVMDHPYFAVTGLDGSFALNSVPPGDYTVEIWHEKLGDQTLQVHLGASEHAAADFTYK